ncbi:hypothetical protein LCGC14_2289880 [marine sediment metagenome]|uniref:Uncharacterized protein n=1 Tax=marine sediment metagenome TaxID=412755 RepID=A0A0F9CS34_9ZZZZ
MSAHTRTTVFSGAPNFDAEELAILKSMGISPNDPAASALIDRIVGIHGLRGRGDPAFQTGSKFLGTKTGRMVSGGLSALDALLGGGGAGGDIDDVLDLGGGGGGSGGGGSFLSSQAGQQSANAFAAQQAQLDRDFALAEADKARGFEREQELERLKAERERIFTDMLGTDPVRAVLFALGIGGEILPGGDRFADLAPLSGARAQADATQQALSKLQGSQVNIGQEGVTGLGSAASLAASFGGQAGGTGGNVLDQKKLLLSGLGVGAKRGKGRPGQSREESLRQIASVTPSGVL